MTLMSCENPVFLKLHDTNVIPRWEAPLFLRVFALWYAGMERALVSSMNTQTQKAIKPLQTAKTRNGVKAALIILGGAKAELISLGVDWGRVEREAHRAMRATR